MLRFLSGPFVLLALSSLSACQTSPGDDDATEGDIARCRALCETNRACPGGAPERDCFTYCVDLDPIIVGGRCRIRYGAVLDCGEALDDLCDAPTDCDMELRDYDACASAYCATHAEECAGVLGPF